MNYNSLTLRWLILVKLDENPIWFHLLLEHLSISYELAKEKKKESISYTSKIKKISSKYGQPNYGDDFKWVV